MPKSVFYRYNDESGLWHIYLTYPANSLDGIESREVEVSQSCDEEEAESIVEAIKEWAGVS